MFKNGLESTAMESEPNKPLYFLSDDYSVLEQKMLEYTARMKALALEQAEGKSQSTENQGHDDAVQEAVEQERRVLNDQISNLSAILKRARLLPNTAVDGRVKIGSRVTLSDGRKIKVGSYITFSQRDGGYVVASYPSPVALPMLGLEAGDTFYFRGLEIEILAVD